MGHPLSRNSESEILELGVFPISVFWVKGFLFVFTVPQNVG